MLKFIRGVKISVLGFLPRSPRLVIRTFLSKSDCVGCRAESIELLLVKIGREVEELFTSVFWLDFPL